MATIVIPNSERPAVGHPRRDRAAGSPCVCQPPPTIISETAQPEEQGRALGSNQSLQVGAEAASGLGGGLLAAIADVLPLTAMAALAAAACLCYCHVPTDT